MVRLSAPWCSPAGADNEGTPLMHTVRTGGISDGNADSV
jgi:hypothetical protein